MPPSRRFRLHAEVKAADPEVVQTPAKKMKRSTNAPTHGTGAVIIDLTEPLDDDVGDLF